MRGRRRPCSSAGSPRWVGGWRAGGQAGEPRLAQYCRRPRPLKSPGVLPQVILACNSGPALNDVTYSESLIVAERIAAMDPVVR